MRNLTPEAARCQARDQVIDTLSRLRGMFGAMQYLMGEAGALEGEAEDFACLAMDVKERLDQAIEQAGHIR